MKDKVNFIIKIFLTLSILFTIFLYVFQNFSQNVFSGSIAPKDEKADSLPNANKKYYNLLNIEKNTIKTKYTSTEKAGNQKKTSLSIGTSSAEFEKERLNIEYETIPFDEIADNSFERRISIIERKNQTNIMEEYYNNVFAIEFADKFHDFDLYTHTVRQGENLSTIAYNKGINIDTIISFNYIVEGHTIPIGKKLRLPNQSGVLHKIKPGDNLSKIADRYHASVEEIKNINRLDSGNKELFAGQTLFIPNGKLTPNEIREAFVPQYIFPVSGRVSSLYGMRTLFGKRGFHPGIDIAANKGTKIRAFRKGRVTVAKYYGGYGYCVFIKHKNGLETRYGHMLSKPLVKVGQWVQNGQLLGYVGNTGVSYGCHLHFETREYGKTVDPYKYLKKWMKSGNKINQWVKTNFKLY